jgi:CheY-like chemotaxis protein
MRVLIVDDDSDARAFLEGALSMAQPIIATHAKCAHEAFEWLGMHGPATSTRFFDLVLLDLDLPDLSGVSVCRRVRAVERFRSLPIVLVSAYGQGPLVRTALAAGANDYMVKPIRADELRARVQCIVGRVRTARRQEPLACRPEATQPMRVIAVDAWLLPRVPLFLAHKRTEVGQIPDALARGAFEDIKLIGHNLHGTAQTYGFADLGELGSKLEAAADRHDPSGIECVVAEIIDHLESIRVIPRR